MNEQSFVTAEKNLGGRMGSKMTNEAPKVAWRGGAGKGSFWLCYAESLAGRQKRGISDSPRRRKSTPCERNSWNVGEKEGEEEEPAIERRREYTDVGLGEREGQVACHASALALAMTDETYRKRRCKPHDFHCFFKRQRKPYVFH